MLDKRFPVVCCSILLSVSPAFAQYTAPAAVPGARGIVAPLPGVHAVAPLELGIDLAPTLDTELDLNLDLRLDIVPGLDSRVEAAAFQAPESPLAGMRRATSGLLNKKGEAGAKAGARLGRIYDGALGKQGSFDAPAVAAAWTGAGSLALPALSASRMATNSDSPPALSARDGKAYRPSVVFILDVFEGEASQAVADYINNLVDQKVQVVIVSDRPESGAGSIKEVLLEKLNIRRDNPVMVVASNGGKIFAWTSKADNHQEVVDSAPGFTPEELSAISGAAVEISKQFGVELGEPELAQAKRAKSSSVLSASFRLPAEFNQAPADKRSDAAKRMKARGFVTVGELWAADVNKKIREAGLPYRVELNIDVHGNLSAVTHVVPLHGSLTRIREGLVKMMYGKDILKESPEQALVMANPRWWANFQRNLPRGTKFLGAKSPAEAEEQLAGLLGTAALKESNVDRYKLVEYVRWREFQDSMRRNSAGKGGGGGSGSYKGRNTSERNAVQPAYLWRAIVISQAITAFVQAARDGQWDMVTEKRLIDFAERMWSYGKASIGGKMYYPNMPGQVLAARRSPYWKKYSGGFKSSMRTWLTNFFLLRFPNFQSDVEAFVETLTRVGDDYNSLAYAKFNSPINGRRYSINAKVPLVRAKRDGKTGRWSSIGTLFRTGAHNPAADEIDAKVTALALLQNEGIYEKDGEFFLNGQPLDRVTVEIQYARTIKEYHFTRDGGTDPNAFSFADAEADVANVIEQSRADEEFQKYYDELTEKREKEKAAGKKKD